MLFQEPPWRMLGWVVGGEQHAWAPLPVTVAVPSGPEVTGLRRGVVAVRYDHPIREARETTTRA